MQMQIKPRAKLSQSHRIEPKSNETRERKKTEMIWEYSDQSAPKPKLDYIRKEIGRPHNVNMSQIHQITRRRRHGERLCYSCRYLMRTMVSRIEFHIICLRLLSFATVLYFSVCRCCSSFVLFATSATNPGVNWMHFHI